MSPQEPRPAPHPDLSEDPGGPAPGRCPVTTGEEMLQKRTPPSLTQRPAPRALAGVKVHRGGGRAHPDAELGAGTLPQSGGACTASRALRKEGRGVRAGQGALGTDSSCPSPTLLRPESLSPKCGQQVR